MGCILKNCNSKMKKLSITISLFWTLCIPVRGTVRGTVPIYGEEEKGMRRIGTVPNKPSALYFVIAYDQPSESAIRQGLKRNFPDKEKFLNTHRIVQLIIHGSDEFCANEFIVTNGVKSIEAVLLIFTAQNEWIATYCHKVIGFTWGYIFIPIENGNQEIGFIYKNKYGKIEIAREMQI